MLKEEKKLNNYRIKYISKKIVGIRVNFVNLKQALFLISKWLKSNKQYQITTPNPEHIVFANNNYRLKNVINNSDLAIADGMGLIWAAKQFRIKNQESRIKNKLYHLSGVDLMQGMCKLAGKKGLRAFLLGGRGNAAKLTAENLKKQSAINNQQLTIAYDQGAKDINKETLGEREHIINVINAFKPHFLFVAYGAPWQEYWIAENLPKLNVRIAMGVGGAFDYLSGKVKRAPKFVRKNGYEWLWRLIKQPWRVKRQLNLLKFVYLVLTSKHV